MKLWDADEREYEEKDTVDERLAAYYGPRLPAQPLPASSWLQLQSQLTRTARPRRRFLKHIFARRRSQHHVPRYIQNAFAQITHAARVSYSPTLLCCSFNVDGNTTPQVHISPFAAWHIKLLLPLAALSSLEPAMLDVLLAAGLARYLLMRRALYRLLSSFYLCLGIISLFSGIAAALQKLPLAVLLLCTLLLACSLSLLYWQQRMLVLAADKMIVLWLGRAAVCQGLHSLADHSPTPARSRWSEPALTLRISRICGTELLARDERLTLSRK